MQQHGQKSREWRDRAEECRWYAEEAKTASARASFFEIAQNCDEIAARLERVEEHERTSGRPK